MVFSRSVTNRVGPFERSLPVCNDWDFVLRSLELARPVPVDVPGTYYRRHSRYLTGDASAEAGEEEWQVIRDRYLAHHPHNRRHIERRVGAAMAVRRARAAAHDRSRWMCAAELLCAFAYSPTQSLRILAPFVVKPTEQRGRGSLWR